MAKGIKMDCCHSLLCGSNIFFIKQIKKEDNGNLICRFCPAKVMYVSSHMRKSSKRKIPTHLKLWFNENHDEHCPNTVKCAVNKLVAKSKAIEGNSPILEKQHDNTVIFRLNFLKEAQKSFKALAEQSDVRTNNRKAFVRNNYIEKQQQLASYFSSAAGLAKIRALIQNSKDIEEFKKTVKIQYKNQLITWNDFYYDISRYYILAKKLESSEGLKLDHPIALNVAVKKSFSRPKIADIYDWEIQCFSGQYAGKDKDKIVVPRIKTSLLNIGKAFSIQSTYILVGDVWLYKKSSKDKIFSNINIAVENEAQFQIDIG